MTEELRHKLRHPLRATACRASAKLGGSAGGAFTNPANGISSYEGEETTAVFKYLGTPKSSIFRVKAGSMRLVMLMKLTKAADDFGNKRAAGSSEDAHRS